MKLGEIAKYVVIRETDIGFMLQEDSKYQDENFPDGYFLHKNESNHLGLREGDKVDAFLYQDKQHRFALTCYLPYITLEKGALCEVVSVTAAGAFINIGISKDILFSNDDYNNYERPMKGDKLPVKLRLKGTSIYIKLLNKEQILENNDGYKYAVGEKTFGYVYRITKDGINLVDEHYNIIFIHRNNLRKAHHLGEKVEFSIFGMKEQEGYTDFYGTCIQSKENMIEDDAETILTYLKEHHGIMTYNEETDPLVIDKVFHMSKLAFKRALGHLYKKEVIVLINNKVALKR